MLCETKKREEKDIVYKIDCKPIVKEELSFIYTGICIFLCFDSKQIYGCSEEKKVWKKGEIMDIEWNDNKRLPKVTWSGQKINTGKVFRSAAPLQN